MLDIVIMEIAKGDVTASFIITLVEELVKRPPAIPCGVIAYRESYALIAHPLRVSLCLRVADTYGYKIGNCYRANYTKLLEFTPDWLRFVADLKQFPYIISRWLVWGMDWAFIDIDDVERVIVSCPNPDEIRTLVDEIETETALRSICS